MRHSRIVLASYVWHNARCSNRLSSKAAASEGPKAYPLGYVEGLNDARTLLAARFSILLVNLVWCRTSVQHGLNILQTDQSHLNPRAHGGGAQMGEQHHLFQLRQC